MDDKIIPKIVMDEGLVQNTVMNEDLDRNGVMDRKILEELRDECQKIDPKVVMDLSTFKIGGSNSLQPIKICWTSRGQFLLTQHLERHSVDSDQDMKKLMSLREGLHVMMHCSMRQHVTDRY